MSVSLLLDVSFLLDDLVTGTDVSGRSPPKRSLPSPCSLACKRSRARRRASMDSLVSAPDGIVSMRSSEGLSGVSTIRVDPANLVHRFCLVRIVGFAYGRSAIQGNPVT